VHLGHTLCRFQWPGCSLSIIMVRCYVAEG
jgi:hypothetical protein